MSEVWICGCGHCICGFCRSGGDGCACACHDYDPLNDKQIAYLLIHHAKLSPSSVVSQNRNMLMRLLCEEVPARVRDVGIQFAEDPTSCPEYGRCRKTSSKRISEISRLVNSKAPPRKTTATSTAKAKTVHKTTATARKAATKKEARKAPRKAPKKKTAAQIKAALARCKT